MSKHLEEQLKTLHGGWRVTTEGDCEGRTTKNLGDWYGYVDEIALTLGSQGGYTLEFTAIDMKSKQLAPINKEVNVRINGAFDNSNLSEISARFHASGRPVHVERCPYYKSFTIVNTAYDKNAATRKSALDKLTAEELRVLRADFEKANASR